MREALRPRTTPALAVSVLALVAALAGTAVAADPAADAAVGKKKVRKIARQQASRQIAKLAPTLSVARAETAGSADSADTATTAGTADMAANADNARLANGVLEQPVFYSQPDNTAEATLLTDGRFRLTMACETDDDAPQVRAVLDNPTNGTVLSFAGVDSGNAARGGDQFNPGFLGLVAPTVGSSSGQLTVRAPSGRMITLSYHGEERVNGYGTDDDCFFYGHMRSSG